MSFNLVNDPWVPVLDGAGTSVVGLGALFDGAEQMTVAAGLLEDQAIYQLLLAIAYAALGAPEASSYPEAVDGAQVGRWLRANQDAFDVEGAAPFAQSAAAASAPVPPGVLDATLGRDRPILTDHRALSDRPALSVPEAVRLLLVHQHYSPGGRHTALSVSLPEAMSTGLIRLRVSGTVAEALRWGRIPVPSVGTPHWTLEPTQRGTAAGALPAGELDALTWQSRGYRLVLDGDSVTSVLAGPGWRRAVHPDPDAPFDTQPGRRNMLTAKDPSKPLKGGEARVFGLSAGSGEPVGLQLAWESGSEGSFSAWVRGALTDVPIEEHPVILATGHAVKKSLIVGAFCTPIPRAAGGLSERATQVREAWREARVPDGHEGLRLLFAETGEDTVADLVRLIRPSQPAPSIEWPSEAAWMMTRREAPEAAIPEDVLAAFGSSVIESLVRDNSGSSAERLLGAQQHLWMALHQDTEAAARLAVIMETRLPSPEEIPASRWLPVDEPATHLWAGLIGYWVTHVSADMGDSRTPLPMALRYASHEVNRSSVNEVLEGLYRRVSGLRVPLMSALDIIGQEGWRLSWRSLYHDLHHWSLERARVWVRSYHHPPKPSVET